MVERGDEFITIEYDTDDDAQKNNTWIKLNANAMGFYRVNYDDDMYLRLGRALSLPDSAELFSESDVASLLDDRFALSLSGIDNGEDNAIIMQVIAMMKFVKERTLHGLAQLEYSPWIIMMNALDYLIFRLGSRRCFTVKFFEGLVDDLLTDVLDKYIPTSPTLGTGDTDDAITLLRSRLWLTQIQYGSLMGGPLHDPDDDHNERLSLVGCTLTDAVVMGNILSMHVETRDIAYAIAIQVSKLDKQARKKACRSHDLPNSSRLLDLMIAQLDELRGNPDEFERLLVAITTMPQRKRLLELALTDTIRAQDKLWFIRRIAYESRGSLDIVWRFLVDNLDMLVEKFSGTGAAAAGIGRLLTQIAGQSTTDEKLDELLEAYARLPEEDQVDWVLGEAKERMVRNQQWEEKNAEPVCEYLASTYSFL